jgi:hypothetical protein
MLGWMEAHQEAHEIHEHLLGFFFSSSIDQGEHQTGHWSQGEEEETRAERTHAPAAMSGPSLLPLPIAEPRSSNPSIRCDPRPGSMPPVADPGPDFFFSHAWGIRGSGNARRSFPNGALAGIDCSSHGGDDDGCSRWRFLMMGRNCRFIRLKPRAAADTIYWCGGVG